MTTTNGGPPEPQPQPQQTLPQLNVLGQYIKDFSFENPNAPKSLAPSQNQPTINVAINLGLQQLGQVEYEVSLRVEGKAENSGTVMFAFDLTFAGIFRLQNVPPEHLQPVLLIECPRLLFPFAREVIATAVRNGGFGAFLLRPGDFCPLLPQPLGPGRGAPAAHGAGRRATRGARANDVTVFHR